MRKLITALMVFGIAFSGVAVGAHAEQGDAGNDRGNAGERGNRPDSPPGLGNRPDSPPGLGNRPDSPPGLGNRPDSPPGLGNRPIADDRPGHGVGVRRPGRDDRRHLRNRMRRHLRREVRNSVRHARRHGRYARQRRGEDAEIGRTVIDVHGNRVRVEKYFDRPAANQIRTRVLNTRPEIGRIDQSVWTGTFNRDLPNDLRRIPRRMWGGIGLTPPDYYLTRATRQDVSGTNSFVSVQDGGWIYSPEWSDLNNPSLPGDSPMIASGQLGNMRPYVVVFNDEIVSVNGTAKVHQHRINQDPANNVLGDVAIFHPTRDHSDPRGDGSNLGHVVTVTTVDLNGDGIYEHVPVHGAQWDISRPISVVRFRERGQDHQIERIVFADGTWMTNEYYRINDNGDVIGRGVPRWNANDEVIHQASEFGVDAAGRPRTIDIVVTPGPVIPTRGDVPTQD